MTGTSVSDAPGPTGSGQGIKDYDMHAGVQEGIPVLAAATMVERRMSVFKQALHRAASRVSPTHTPDSHNSFSIGTAAVHKAAMFLESAECTHYRSVLKASARGRRVS